MANDQPDDATDETPAEPLTHVTIDGKTYPVYPPTKELWHKLWEAEDALKTKGYYEEIVPILFRGGALGFVANDCCRLPESPFYNPTWKASYENVEAIAAIIETWDTSYYWTAYFYGFVQECTRRVLFHLLDIDRNFSLITDPHPELRDEAIAAGRAAAAFSAPAPPDLYDEDEEEEPESTPSGPVGSVAPTEGPGTPGASDPLQETAPSSKPRDRAAPIEPSIKLTKEEQALAILMKYPHWSDTRIADYVGCARTSLYRMKKFMAARAVLEQGKSQMPGGEKDAKSQRLEAWERDE